MSYRRPYGTVACQGRNDIHNIAGCRILLLILRYCARYPDGPRSKLAHGNGADMGASAPVSSVAIALIAALVVSDYVFSVRRTYPSTLREAPAWSAIYLAIAIAFGAGVWAFGGISMSVEYFACYVSNEAISIDNLFVFLFTVRSFAVPRIAQQKCCYSASSWRWRRAPDLSTAVG